MCLYISDKNISPVEPEKAKDLDIIKKVIRDDILYDLKLLIEKQDKKLGFFANFCHWLGFKRHGIQNKTRSKGTKR